MAKKRKKTRGHAVFVTHLDVDGRHRDKMVGRMLWPHNLPKTLIFEHTHTLSQRHFNTESPGGIDTHVVGVLCGQPDDVTIWIVDVETGEETAPVYRRADLNTFLRNCTYQGYGNRRRLFLAYEHYESFTPDYKSVHLQNEWPVPLQLEVHLRNYLERLGIVIMGLPEPYVVEKERKELQAKVEGTYYQDEND